MVNTLSRNVAAIQRRADRLRYRLRRMVRRRQADEAGLVFIHHSCGNDWLLRALDAQLLASNWIGPCSSITYGVDVSPDPGRPDSLHRERPPGDYTDMHHWIRWFNDYFEGIKAFGRAGGQNRIVMFKSCFPNSNIAADGEEPGSPWAQARSLTNYKALFRHPAGPGKLYTFQGHDYRPLEQIFGQHPTTTFIAVTAPPRHFAPKDATTDAEAARARSFNTWLKDEWLTAYKAAYPGLNNVIVFDWFDFLAYAEDHPEHPNRLKAVYGGASGDSHPNRRAARESTEVFLQCLAAESV